MSVLGTISLSGLTTTTSDYIYANEIEITGNLTLDPGSTLTLQPNSISDSALSSNVALKNATNTFTNNNTFSNLLTMTSGFNSLGQGTIRRATANVHLRMIDTTFNSFGDLYTRNQILYLRQNLANSLIRFQLYNASNVISDVFTIGTDQALFNISVPITQNGVMPAASDSSTKTPTTAWVQSAISSLLSSNNIWTGTNNFSVSFPTCSVTIPASNDSTTKLSTTQWVQSAITANNTSLLSSVNTWTASNTFSRTAGNMNLRLLDSTNNTTFTGAVGNNQINLIMSNNDSKIYFNTITPGGVQTDTLLINSTTTTFRTSNPLVQATATMPAASDSSTNTPTTAWVQSAISANNSSLLSSNNTWTGTNTFNLQLNANGGIVLNLPSGQSAIQIIDNTSLNSNTLSVNGVAARYIQNGISSVHNFFVRDSLNVQVTAVSISKALVSINSDTMTFTGPDPATNDNTGKVATTRWVTLKQNNFLTLNNTWTGTNQFNNVLTVENSGANIPLFISSSSQTNYKGCHFISAGAGSYNPMVQANEYVVFGYNSTALDLSTLTLTTHSNTSSGIKITNNLTKVYGANEFDTKIKTSRTSSPTSQCLGNIYKVECVSGITTNFFLSTWNGTTNISLYSYTFDDSTDNKRFGTYLVKVALNYENSVATTALCCNVNTINATDNLSANMQTVGTGNTMLIGGNFQYNINFSFVEQVYSTKTFYMNVTRTTSGVGGFTNTSYISWTRIA